MELKCLIVYVLSFFNIQVVDWLRATCDVVDDELPIYSAYINHIIRTASALVIRFFYCVAYSTLCLRNVPPLFCCNFDKHKQILIIFDRNITVEQAVKRCLILSPHLTNASALSGKAHKHENLILYAQMLCTCFAKLQLVSTWFQTWFTCNSHSSWCMTP